MVNLEKLIFIRLFPNQRMYLFYGAPTVVRNSILFITIETKNNCFAVQRVSRIWDHRLFLRTENINGYKIIKRYKSMTKLFESKYTYKLRLVQKINNKYVRLFYFTNTLFFSSVLRFKLFITLCYLHLFKLCIYYYFYLSIITMYLPQKVKIIQ